MARFIKRAEKYIQLDDALRVKRQQNPRFIKKRVIEEKPSEINDKRRRKEKDLRDKDDRDNRRGRHCQYYANHVKKDFTHS